MDILSVENLTTGYSIPDRKITAVRDISLKVKEGTRLAIVGESGCGKSALALSIVDLLPFEGRVQSGIVLYKGEILDAEKLRGCRIAYIPQNPFTSLNPGIPVGYQLMEPLIGIRKLKAKEARKVAVNLMRKVGIVDPESRFHQLPESFSGGMLQRLAIAISMSTYPDLIIADEITTALDVTVQRQILQLLDSLVKDNGMTLIMITHDLGVVSHMSDQTIVMYGGRAVEEGLTSEIVNNPLHPYTKALIACKPSLSEKKEILGTIPGTVAQDSTDVAGCSFAPRCDKVMGKCKEALPNLTKIRNSKVRCFIYE